MLGRLKNIELIVRTCAKVEPGQDVLIIADDGARSLKIGQQLAEACTSVGAEVVLTVMAPRLYNGQEPPRSIAEAMQACDIIFQVFESCPIVHTDAAHASRKKGIKFITAGATYGEDYFNRDITQQDLIQIKARSERIAEIVSRTSEASVTSSRGTDLKMSLKGRKGLPIHPLSGSAIITVPDYAEVAISPVEGSTEGVLVTDGGVRGWDLPLTEPLRLTVTKGRVAEISGPEDYVKSVRELLATDENASNCAAELGIGTSHTMPMKYMSLSATAGIIHIALGRNNDIGGQTYSKVHCDLVIYKPTVWLDDLCLIKDGKMLL